MSTLERAIAIAAIAHTGQLDKAGMPYILHPLRVMLLLDTIEERIVGILHDTIEDTDVTFEYLREEGFSEELLTALDAVTKREGEAYETFILRAAADSIGRKVKLADLKDNSNLSRIAGPTPKDFERLNKYQKAVETIHQLYPTVDESL
jgi:(p)ppGpp synthase/HD superfamily hydrolase